MPPLDLEAPTATTYTFSWPVIVSSDNACNYSWSTVSVQVGDPDWVFFDAASLTLICLPPELLIGSASFSTLVVVTYELSDGSTQVSDTAEIIFEPTIEGTIETSSIIDVRKSK